MNYFIIVRIHSHVKLLLRITATNAVYTSLFEHGRTIIEDATGMKQ